MIGMNPGARSIGTGLRVHGAPGGHVPLRVRTAGSAASSVPAGERSHCVSPANSRWPAWKQSSSSALSAAHSLYVGGKQEELRLFLYIWKLIAARQSDDGDDALAQAPPWADAWALN